MKKFLVLAMTAVMAMLPMLSAPVVHAQNPASAPSVLSVVAGKFVARNYAWRDSIQVAGGGSIASGTSVTIPMRDPVVKLNDGRTIMPFAPGVRVTIGAGAAAETVAIISASGCFLSAPRGSCSIVVTTANQHGNSEPVTSGSVGLDEAIMDAASCGAGTSVIATGCGGTVVVDPTWTVLGGTSAIIAASKLTFGLTAIEDDRLGMTRYWNVTATGTANLAAPTGVPVTGQLACDATHQMCSDANVAGSASWSGTVYACWAYVDIMGNEGPCSATTNWTSAASKAIDLAIPAASAGAVGAVPYLSLSGGTYAAAYRILPTSAICTLTTLESTTPACAVANTTFGQSGSTFGANALFNGGAQITGYPVNTSPHFTGIATTASTSASYVDLTNSATTYAFAPGSHVGLPGVSQANVASYVAAGSSATTVPNPVATFTIPAGLFNYQGASFRVKGKFTYTDGGDSSTKVRVMWDSEGTNTTTVPTVLCDMLDTATGTGAAYNGNFDCTVTVATTGATGTALVNGYSAQALAAGATTLVRNALDAAVAPSASINLAGNGRIVVFFVGTGATNNPGAQGLSATLEQVN